MIIHAAIYPLLIAGSILPTFVRPAQRTPPRKPTAVQTKRIPVCISSRRGGPSYTTKGKKGKPTSKHPKPPPPLNFPSTSPPSQDCNIVLVICPPLLVRPPLLHSHHFHFPPLLVLSQHESHLRVRESGLETGQRQGDQPFPLLYH